MTKKTLSRLVKTLLYLACDAVMFLISYTFSILLTGGTGQFLGSRDIVFMLCLLAVTLGIYLAMGLYHMVYWSAGFAELIRIFVSNTAVFVVSLVPMFILWRNELDALPLPRLVFFAFFLLYFNVSVRFSGRVIRSAKFRLSKQHYVRVMVVGGGDAGEMLIREMKSSDKVRFVPVCVIDDDKNKRHLRICDVRVVGNRDDIPRMVERYGVNEIFICIPSAKGEDLRAICGICADTGKKVKILPGIYQYVNGTAMRKQIRDVGVNDLLGREPVRINSEEVFGYIRGKRIMVTGGGGSIGSELCRQIAAHEPDTLVIFDIYENNAYDIQMELRQKFPDMKLKVLIGSVRDVARVNEVFEAERPQIVFHAAAHKHVPLMEDSPNEAIKNNVFGTYNVAKAADSYGADRFVMISTDKAVNPTNVMGATKRICEMIVQTFGRHSQHTEYVAVRFGNVLGSNGSVIPLFKKQIAAGGPVTVTHKDIIRYFMTIPEAVALVLQAGAYAKGGQIFVLDMGEPVKILTLAENLIRLSGYKPYVNMPITFTGLRPGEKLYEELLMDEEGLGKTANKKIRIGRPIDIDEDELKSVLTEMKEKMGDDRNDLRPLIKRLVPTFHNPDGQLPENASDIAEPPISKS